MDFISIINESRIGNGEIVRHKSLRELISPGRNMGMPCTGTVPY